MTTQLYLARGIIRGRVHTDQEPALVRSVELARSEARRERRAAQRGLRAR